jgi:hypothetical protein
VKVSSASYLTFTFNVLPTTVSLKVAVEIIKVALEEGLCTKIAKENATSDEYITDFVARKMYFPSYVPLL